MIAQALKSSMGNAIEHANAGQLNPREDAAAPLPKVPSFAISEYRSTEGSSVSDYFKRFEWALQLSHIREAQYANFARVHMGDQINLNRLFSIDTSVKTITSTELTPDQAAQLSELLDNYNCIFSDVPGKLVGPPAKCSKTRWFYEKVDYSEWASPTHIVVKKNGNLRITGNYKPTVNPRMIVDERLIPKVETIFNKMKGAALFCHLDVTDAYTHLPIDNEFQKAYQDLKQILISPQVLMQYDPALPLILATDASQSGLGAVLSHRLSIGTERPIAYASCTMSKTEQRYPQIDKEALVIVWAVKKFFHYLYARKFTLITDHKPLTQILSPEKSLPTLCISRMANYADYLAHFNFDIIYKPTNLNTNADYCSRVPSKSTQSNVNSFYLGEGRNADDDFGQFAIHQIHQLPVRADNIARETRKDSHLGKIIRDLKLDRNPTQLGYKAPDVKYTLAANCLFFEHRVVIPPALRKAILNDLHKAHIGVVKMKGLARSFVYWPGIDADIERTAKSCAECASHATAPSKFSSHHWEYPNGPWERVHIDYAGPVYGSMLLIIVDAHSKWFEVKVTHSTTTAATVRILDEVFSAYGAPITIVSDNGPQLTAEEFRNYLQKSGVKFHKLSAPYHPATNGQAERYVQTVKRALKAMNTTHDTLQTNINEFLQQYRKAPHTETGESPSKLFLGRNIRTRLDLVRPQEASSKLAEKQRAAFDPSFRSFSIGQHVYSLSGNARMDKWIPGTVVTRLGDLHYEIVYNGKRLKRHVDQMRYFESNERISIHAPSSHEQTGVASRRIRYHGENVTSQETPADAEFDSSARRSSVASSTQDAQFLKPSSSPDQRQQMSPFVLRRSERFRRPPNRFSP
ncbi:uncharacterized protein K02A2.6-like [Wyeomyia smithii]|uniref:uncharacterized protein K02A2.6-like n=1 Tax=Wyeomyia smithii TaxID=174621 RepID=UPI002467DB40|nr:uncharacterized protein K02A2.6-like [Wyeomyia smithii]